MTEKDKIMIDRYIFEVIKRVPKKHREDISKELKELISDMSENDTVENVLNKLGDPAVFARKYSDDSHYLIGPSYYDNYLTVLKIVSICVGISILVSSVIAIIMNELSSIIDILTNLVASGISVFGAVTLVFAILERRNVKFEVNNKKWSVNDLTEVTELERKVWSSDTVLIDKKAIIKRSDTVVSIVFTVIFCVLIAAAPQLFGYYVFNSENELIKTIPVFNIEKWNMIAPLWIASMLAGLVDDIICLVTGFYCKVVVVSKVITGSIQVALTYIILKVMPFWNPSFVSDLSELLDVTFSSKTDLLTYWNTSIISNIFLAIICFATLLEIIISIYKTIKYKNNLKETCL